MLKILKEDDLEKMVDILLGGTESEKDFDPNYYLRNIIEISFTEIGCCDDNPLGFSYEEVSRLELESAEFNYFWRKLQEVE